MPFIHVNNIDLYYEQTGKGDNLILLAGLAANHRTWSKMVHELSKHYLVTIPENRGAGRTSQPDEAYTIEQMADDIAMLMSLNDMDSAYIVGSSMGGKILQSMCLRHPDKVRAAIMAGTSARIPAAALMQVKTTIALIEAGVAPTLILETVMPWLYTEYFIRDSENLTTEFNYIMEDPFPQSLTGYKGQVKALEAFDSSAYLNKIKQPTLVVVGELDIYVPAKFSKFVADSIPTSKYQVIDDCGHMFHSEKPEAFIQMILDFFKST